MIGRDIARANPAPAAKRLLRAFGRTGFAFQHILGARFSALQPVSVVAPVDRGPPTSARERAARDLKTGVLLMNHNINVQQQTSSNAPKRPFNLKSIRLEICEQQAAALLKFSRQIRSDVLSASVSEGESLEDLVDSIDELAFALARDLREQCG